MPYGFAEAVMRTAEPHSSPAAPLAPPSWFRAAEGVRSAWPVPTSPFGRTPARGGTAAQRAGRAYEKKAQRFLQAHFGEVYKAGKWFKYLDSSGFHFCQLDGFIHGPDGLVIVEIKTTFTTDAWWQVRKLYEPVVRKAYLQAPQIIIVCKNFDPAVAFPEPVRHLAALTKPELSGGAEICVFQWRP